MASELSWRSILVLIGLVLAGWLFLELRLVTVPAVLALFGTTLLRPAVAALGRRGWRPILATWTVLAAVALLVAAGLALLVPAFLGQMEDLGAQFDEGIGQIEEWLETGPLGIEDADIMGSLQSAAGQLADAGPALIDGATLVGEVIAAVLIALVMLFFFLKDGPRIVSWGLGHVPPVRRTQVGNAADAAYSALAAFVRATLIVGVVNGTAIGVAMVILGIPLAFPVAVITAVGAFFPVVGAVVAGALAALIALVAGGLVDALILVGITVAVQQLESDVLSPVIMGRVLRLHPLVILVVLTVGAVVAGILGAFLAVPVAAMSIAAVTTWRRDQHLVIGSEDP